MKQEKPPVCMNCGKEMIFSTRISLPPQVVYRCVPCKLDAWILDREQSSADDPPDTQPDFAPGMKQ